MSSTESLHCPREAYAIARTLRIQLEPALRRPPKLSPSGVASAVVSAFSLWVGCFAGVFWGVALGVLAGTALYGK